MKSHIVLFCLIFLLALGFTFECARAAEKEVELEPITVTLEPFEGQGDISTKNEGIIYPDSNPAISLDKMLDYQEGVDLSTRGILNIQSDLSIRGSTADQVSVSINGIRVNDPQTSHHNLDLPIPQNAIDRVTIIEGSSVQDWSQGVMGGAVNLTTKRPTETAGDISFFYGTDQTQRALVYVSKGGETAGINFSAEEATSNGWRYDTDFKEFSASSAVFFELRDNISSYIFAGYGEKEFGAAGFYGPYDSKEWTNTFFLNWDTTIELNNIRLIPKLYFRRHHDKYMLDIARPDYYLNHHRTDIEGIQCEASTDLEDMGLFSITGEAKREDIKSTRLGKDSRRINSLSLSWKNYRHSIFGYDGSLRIDGYSDYDTEILPQAGIFLRPLENIKIRGGVSKGARPPSYTELFYDSPANKGNRNLSSESAVNYEAGIDLNYKEKIKLSCTFFRRDSSELIDWIKDSPGDAFYQARNITEVKTEGIEVEADARCFKWFNIKGGYTYIDSDIKKDYNYVSKYALNNPDHKVTAQADFMLDIGKQSIRLLYKNRKNYSSYITMGCDLSYTLNRYSNLFLTVDNIFNSTYWDISDNTLPGREIRMGARVKF